MPENQNVGLVSEGRKLHPFTEGYMSEQLRLAKTWFFASFPVLIRQGTTYSLFLPLLKTLKLLGDLHFQEAGISRTVSKQRRKISPSICKSVHWPLIFSVGCEDERELKSLHCSVGDYSDRSYWGNVPAGCLP